MEQNIAKACDNNKIKNIVFFGHSYIFQKEKVRQRLYDIVENYIKVGYKDFIMGKYGDFDDMALSVCRELRKKYNDIKITVIFTSYATFNKKTIINHVKGFEDEIITYSKADEYSDVQTSLYFVEYLHFKRRIIQTNRYMIDDSNLVICYINPQKTQSGAKTAVNYAKKQKKQIINIFDEKDYQFL